MKFLVQTVNKQITYDFIFELTTCKEYFDWIGRDFKLKKHEGLNFDDIKNPDQYVPVGSVEFVSEYLRKFYPQAEKALIPINVPEQLFPFAGRTIANITKPEDMNGFDCLVYRKSLDTIKDPNNGWWRLPEYEWCKGYQLSSSIDNILSEWRVFVFRDMILDARCYKGDCFVGPDRDTVQKMVEAYKDAPVAYTLDVAVTSEGKTIVIECHRFFSCGLYGFCEHDKYPVMLSQEWFEMKNMR